MTAAEREATRIEIARTMRDGDDVLALRLLDRVPAEFEDANAPSVCICGRMMTLDDWVLCGECSRGGS